MGKQVTIFKNIYAKDPYYISVFDALDRIKKGKSKGLVDQIRKTIDKERSQELKKNLPSICFSGKFTERKDDCILEHSGFVCLDFDNVSEDRREDLIKDEYIFSVWTSPSGNGLKALVKIKESSKHRQHYQALIERFADIDVSGINESRVCYESYDPEIYINSNSKTWSKIKTELVSKQVDIQTSDVKFDRILKWLANNGDAFVKGERNVFIFKLASACCRFGISKQETERICINNYSFGNDFSEREVKQTVDSAYNSNDFATAQFENENLVDVSTGEIVNFSSDIFDLDIRPKDVIFGEDVKDEILSLYRDGYSKVDGIGIDKLDEIFRLKRGDLTGLTGIGNYGKSTFFKWYLLMRVLIFDEKFAFFSPEDVSHEFFFDLLESYFGMDLTPENKNRPHIDSIEKIHDKLSRNIFYVYPKEISPTPEYIKERFLELIIKEKIDGCIIDPFNQLANNYSKTGGRSDKYLETFLYDCSRFAMTNNVYFLIVMHPKTLIKPKGELNYPEPDVFDIADGAMWNNKLDNILVYHRPFKGEDPIDDRATLSSKKIRRQKVVGRPGTVMFNHDWKKRRFIFEGVDYLDKVINKAQGELIPTEGCDYTTSLNKTMSILREREKEEIRINEWYNRDDNDDIDFSNPIDSDLIPF